MHAKMLNEKLEKAKDDLREASHSVARILMNKTGVYIGTLYNYIGSSDYFVIPGGETVVFSGSELRTDESSTAAQRVAAENLDKTVKRVLEFVYKCASNQQSGIAADYDRAHLLARHIAENSAVLLKNENKALPLGEEADIALIGEGVRKAYEEILVPAGMGDVAIFTEMGRFMTGPYGALIATAIHEKHIYKEYIGLDACAANLMRPAMYGAYHHITVLGKEDASCDHKYDVVGGLCENNDKFAVDRMLPKIDIGDLIYIHDTGAHGSAMGYNYNGKLRSAEVLLCADGGHSLIRRAETPRDYFATLDFTPYYKKMFPGEDETK